MEVLYKKMTINLANYSYEEWLDFIFKHHITEPPWHFEKKWEYECSSNVLINYMIDLFCTPEVLIEKYSYEEIDQGFGKIEIHGGRLRKQRYSPIESGRRLYTRDC